MSGPRAIRRVAGRPIPLPGNDIDTDRILPARFMKAVTFEGLEAHLFADDRAAADGLHPLDDPRFQGSGPRIALVNKNFGCGSSREHAPQALFRWGVRGLVGESFADIFFGNCVALGMPCVTADAGTVAALMRLAEEDPEAILEIDLEALTVRARDRTYPVALPASARQRFLDGSWDATGVLLEAAPAVREVAARLPYLRGFDEDRP